MNYIFATPIEIIDLSNNKAITTEVHTALHNINFCRVNDIHHGDIEISNGTLEKNIIEDISLINLKECILRFGNQYCKELDILTEVPLRITNSWFFKTGPLGYGAKHSHKCLIAGVYYVKTTGTDGYLRFHNHIDDNLVHMFNGRYVDLTPNEAKLILFPGWLPHEITTNNSNESRISIGFHLDV